MGYVSFDCTQFLIFTEIDELQKSVIENALKKFGFHLNNLNEMSKAKKNFINSHIKDNLVALELKDENFIGEFDEWEFEKFNDPPEKIHTFIDLIKNIHKKTMDLTLIFVQYLYEDLENQIFSKEILMKDLTKNLYSLSKFGSGGNIVIITLKNDN